MSSNVDDAERRRRVLSVHERADRLLEYLDNEGSFVGDEIAFDHDAPSFMELSAWSESTVPDEVDYLLEYLRQRGFIELQHVGDSAALAKVTMNGYARLAEIRQRHVVSNQAFVAMWFDRSMTAAYDQGIEAAIFDSGYRAVRIDRKDHNNKIDDEIVAEIRRSRFLVADFTQGEFGARGGVYYEAGFAHGLNIPVIFTCREDAIEKLHFDTRQYSHITWKTPIELRTRLAQRISATLGDGPLKEVP